MGKYFLVDFENVHEDGLVGLRNLGEDDCVDIFYTQNANKISFEIVNVFLSKDFKAKLIFHEVRTGKQSLDFQLTAYLGFLIGKDSEDKNKYYIISKDKGFMHVAEFLANFCDKTVQFQNNLVIKQNTAVSKNIKVDEDELSPEKNPMAYLKHVIDSINVPADLGEMKVTDIKEENSMPMEEEPEISTIDEKSVAQFITKELDESNAQTNENIDSKDTEEIFTIDVPTNAVSEHIENGDDTIPDMLDKEKEYFIIDPLMQGLNDIESIVVPAKKKEYKKRTRQPKKAKKTTEETPKTTEKSDKELNASKEEKVENTEKTDLPEKVEKVEKKEKTSKKQPDEKTLLNSEIQKTLSKAKLDTKIISSVSKLVASKFKEEHMKKAIYQDMIKEFGQKQGLEIYNMIKKLLEKKN